MFIEVDDGCYVNLENIFSITYKGFNNKGVWVFSSSHVEERDRSLADKSNRKINSRSFQTRDEAETWLDGILNRVGVVKDKKSKSYQNRL
ncbi:MAG: hypothetical protein B6241_02685 [Spirochaetaceae bacterium 4572_59]|nr:MAG: hypothetical protein B6241_02685 [Spirochaetaceae bacterium 4572_59]